MPFTLVDKFIVWATLLTGLCISGVAIYYSVAGLATIFSAAIMPIIIMGVTLEIGKLVATVWLKQNWNIAPITIRIYLLIAIFMLMFITSMGIFGFLSKAHSDQNLVSGDVQSKISVYDEKIKIAKENIDANRRALKQLDEAVDQVMGRSTTEQGAERSVQIRRQQGPERQRLIREIEAEQKKISSLNEERAPIAAEVRKVEAEVGPIKYIAKLLYDDDPDANILEKAVSWVIIMIVIVFDPLAVILLLSAQITFIWMREQKNMTHAYEPDDGPLTESQIEQVKATADKPVDPTAKLTYLFTPGKFFRYGVYPSSKDKDIDIPQPEIKNNEPLFVQNEEQTISDKWSKTSEAISPTEYQEASLTRQEVTLFEWIDKIKSGKATIRDVPAHMIPELKKRM